MNSFNEIVNQDKPVLIDFYADWCGPCKVLAPILKEVKNELKGAVTILKIDIDKNKAVASKLKIMSVPTLILYKNGTIVWRQSGLISKDTLLSQIKKYV